MLISVIFKICVPVIISVALFLCLFYVKREKSEGGIWEIIINPTVCGISIFTIKMPFPKISLVKAILFCSSVAMSSTLLFVDYSSFFPDNLQLQAFFDQDGISESLKAFSEDELKRLGIPDNYKQFQKKYYDGVNIVLKEIFQKNDDTTFNISELCNSTGDVKFVVQKYEGIQKYYIEKASGKLENTLEKRNMIPLTFTTFVEKKKSRYNYVSPSLKDIFIKRAIIIQPRCKQIFSKDLKSAGKTFDHILVCVTKVYFFPIPKLSNTIYMIEFEGIGLIPIGYGIYR